jgi:ribosomal protein L21E
MQYRFTKGDRIRIDIPDETDPDHDEFHGRHGEIVDVLEDDLGKQTGEDCDSYRFRVELDEGDEVMLRWRDLRPPLE